MGIDAILICFCIDLKENKGSGSYMMPDSLRRAMGKSKAHKDAQDAAKASDGEHAPQTPSPADGGGGGPVEGGTTQVKMI